MIVLNYLILFTVALGLLGFILLDIYLFCAGITIIKEDLQDKEEGGIFYKIVTTIFKIIVELLVIIITYLLTMNLIGIINVMLKGGNITW